MQTIIPLGSGNGPAAYDSALFHPDPDRRSRLNASHRTLRVLQDVPEELKARMEIQRARPRCAGISRRKEPSRQVRSLISPQIRRTTRHSTLRSISFVGCRESCAPAHLENGGAELTQSFADSRFWKSDVDIFSASLAGLHRRAELLGGTSTPTAFSADNSSNMIVRLESVPHRPLQNPNIGFSEVRMLIVPSATRSRPSPLAARAQQPAVSVIGFLAIASRDTFGFLIGGVSPRPRGNGYVEDKNVAVEYCWADDDVDRLASSCRSDWSGRSGTPGNQHRALIFLALGR